jgi:serine/threonine protein kinase
MTQGSGSRIQKIVTKKSFGLPILVLLKRFSFQVIIIAQQIAQGMGYLHHKGIVHKDLKTKVSKDPVGFRSGNTNLLLYFGTRVQIHCFFYGKTLPSHFTFHCKLSKMPQYRTRNH